MILKILYKLVTAVFIKIVTHRISKDYLSVYIKHRTYCITKKGPWESKIKSAAPQTRPRPPPPSPCGSAPTCHIDRNQMMGYHSLQQRGQYPSIQHVVPAKRGVPGDVAECPHGLFAYVLMRGAQQRHKHPYGPRLHHHAGLRRRSRGYVGQCPSSFKLKTLFLILDSKKRETNCMEKD